MFIKLPTRLPGALAAVVLVMLGSETLAAKTHWINPGAGDWFVPGNWDAGVPTSSEAAYIANGGTALISTVGARASNVYVGLDASHPLGFLGIMWGGSMDSQAGSHHDAYLGYESGSEGTAGVIGSGSMWTDLGSLSVGHGGTGTLNITAGGQVSSEDASLGRESGSQGTVTVTSTGSKWTNSRSLHVGYSGTGTLNITGGGEVSSSGARLGTGAGSQGTATVTGTGSKWSTSSKLYVGLHGTGTLNITQGGEVSSEDASLGRESGSQGAATVSGIGSKWTNDDRLDVGSAGSGTLNITAGGQVSSERTRLGYSFGGRGTVSVSGDQSKWTNASDLFVGYMGTGTLEVTDGGQVTSRGASLGGYRGSQGTATVSGAGSKWSTSSELYVGLGGTGTLNITQGGEVSSEDASLGRESGSQGAATVSGSGSKWTTRWLHVGREGTGTLEIADGGQVCSRGGTVGQGTATVSGPGSKWTISRDWAWVSDLLVGYSGAGTLRVTDGGEVDIEDGTLFASLSDLHGNGTITAKGAVLDAEVVFDSSHGPEQSIAFGTGGALHLDVDGTSTLGAGYGALGTLTITDGLTVPSSHGYLGYLSGSQGSATVSGAGSKWTISGKLYVGREGTGTLHILDGSAVAAGSVSLNSKSLLAMDVGTGSLLEVDGGSGEISNNGIVRLLAGTAPQANYQEAPISAGTSSGSGSYQPIGGTWDDAAHVFTVSAQVPGLSSTPVALDLSQAQRVLVEDTASDWTLGASFPASADAMPITFTAQPLSGDPLYDLQYQLPEGHEVFGAWQLSADGFTPSVDQPVCLSFEIGLEELTGKDISLWHYDGSQWTEFETDVFTYDGQYANFLAESFSAYAVSAVPEPGTLVLLLAAAFGPFAYGWRRQRQRR